MLKEDKPDPTGVGAALRAHWQRTVAEAVETQVQQVRICRGYAGLLRGWLCCSCFQRATFVQQGSLQGWLCRSCLERDTQDHYKSGCVALAIGGRMCPVSCSKRLVLLLTGDCHRCCCRCSCRHGNGRRCAAAGASAAPTTPAPAAVNAKWNCLKQMLGFV